MAEIRPFRALRYSAKAGPIQQLISPLFDIVSLAERQYLYNNPLNSIYLSVPPGEDPGEAANETLADWKDKQLIIKDSENYFYPYYQYFTHPLSGEELCRKGFVCLVRLAEPSENTILQHENTMPDSVEGRRLLLEKVGLQTSPTHGLFSDPACETEAICDRFMENPIYKTDNGQGVREEIGQIADPETLAFLQKILADKKIILADGHHRYAGSLQHCRTCRAENPKHTGEEAYNFHLMYLTDDRPENLLILPTHRLLSDLADFSAERFIRQAEKYFDILPVGNPEDVPGLIKDQKHTFGLVLRDKSLIIKLKEELISKIHWDIPLQVKALDITILHYFLIYKTLGIRGRDQSVSKQLSFERELPVCLRRIETGESDIALITNAVSIAQVREICYAGTIMPQKSTYFYPKISAGYFFAEA